MKNSLKMPEGMIQIEEERLDKSLEDLTIKAKSVFGQNSVEMIRKELYQTSSSGSQ